MPPTPAPLTHAPPLIWAAARALLQTIFALFGDPSRIALQHTHTKRERTMLLSWLRAGEALMRHLLLIEAAQIAKPNTRPLLQASRKLTGRARRLMSFSPDKPEDWRVSFRCFETPPRVSSPARGGRKKRPTSRSAWPLAERAEALLRVFNNPEPYARRLAARLHATPQRAAFLTRYPEHLPRVVDDFPAVQREADVARRRFESG